jgi:hypothetical protein
MYLVETTICRIGNDAALMHCSDAVIAVNKKMQNIMMVNHMSKNMQLDMHNQHNTQTAFQ